MPNPKVSMQYGSGNYTAQNISINGGGGGGITVTLVWTNPSPSSNYSAGTEAMDLSGYDGVLIVTRQAGNTDRVAWDFALVGETTVTRVKNATSGTIYGRSAEVTSSGITFGQGYAGGTAGATNAIPVSVYGVNF